jgi:speckle-type POZ protein
MEVQTVDSSFHELRVNYEQAKHYPIRKAMHSNAFLAGGHMWRIKCYPRGSRESDDGVYLSIFAQLVSKSSSVNAIFEVFLVDKDGQTSSSAAKRSDVHLFQEEDWGWCHFVTHTDLVNKYIIDEHITFMCAVLVIHDRSIPVPPSDMGKHLGTLLDSTDGTDVSFIVDSERFCAHRAVLSARSLVFKAELLGSMAEAAMASITLHDIAPATFRVMLRFIYTDVFPGDDELGESPSEMVQHLLAAADRYALDRLKLMCARKLWSDVSVDTVASTLACAEMHNCLELKNNCIAFFAVEKHFKKAVLTPGFVQLVQQFPTIIDELREKSGT